MNSQELQLVETILRGLMNPNNAERKVSESQLEQLMQNKPTLILALSHLLNNSSDLAILIYAAVILRKLIQSKEDEKVSAVWSATSPEVQEQIKQNVLIALTNCTDRNLKRKLSDIISNMCENIYSSKGKWDDVLKYIIQGFSLPVSPENSLTIETCVYLLSKIFTFAYEQLVEGIDLFIKGFNLFFKEANLNIQTASVEAITEMVGDHLDKKAAKKFRDFTFYILKTILTCLNENQVNNLKICILAFSDICTMRPFMVKKCFADIFILMGKIVEKKELDEENVRGLAFDVILTIVERFPSLLNNDHEKLEVLIKSIFKYAMEFDSEIDEDWLTPKSLSISNEEFIQEPKVDEGLSYIVRLLSKLKVSSLLPIISTIVMELLMHSDKDWRCKYLAYITVGKISCFVDDFSSISQIITMILNDNANPNPKIRYSCLFAYVEFADVFQYTFTNGYHSAIIPTLSAAFSTETVLRVKLQIGDTLQTFFEQCKNSVISPYIPLILDGLFSQFIKPDSECPPSLREMILETFIALLNKCGKNFDPFAEKCFGYLSEYLKVILKTSDATIVNLSPLLLDTLTHVGTFTQSSLKNSALDISKILINFQDNITSFQGEFGDYILSTWERILPHLIEEHSACIHSILESIVKVIQKPPQMSLASDPSKMIDIQAFIKDLNTSPSNVKLTRDRIPSVNTTETEEYTSFLKILCLLLNDLKELSYPFVEVISAQAKQLTSYPNVDIRLWSCKLYPLITNIVSPHLAKDKLAELIKTYLTELIALTSKETENEVLSELLDAISDLLADRDRILTQTELNQLFEKLFEIFDKIEINRLALLKEEDETSKEIKMSTKNPEEDSDDDKEEDLNNIKSQISDLETVLISYTDTIGTIFKTHKELSIEIAKKMIFSVLRKYLDKTASVFEQKMGLFILDDMVEHLGQELLSQIWNDIANILMSFIDNPQCELRQASSFGLGEFVKHTTQSFDQYAQAVLTALNKGLNVSSDGADKDEYANAQDNIVTAMGKLILHQKAHLPVKDVIALWIKHLPIIHDKGESEGMHSLLCDLIMQSPDLIFGSNNENVPRLIRILCQIVDSKKYSTEAIDEKIIQIFNGFKAKEVFAPCIQMAKKDCSKNVLKKVNEYFP